MATGTEAAAAFVTLVIAGLLADAIRPRGRIRKAIEAAIEKRRTATEAHTAIPEVVESLDHIESKQDRVYDKVTDIEEKTDRNAFLIQEFHGDDDISLPVDDILDDDEEFFRGGDHSGHPGAGEPDGSGSNT